MFTGIIEEIGKVKAIVRHANSIKLTIGVNKILEDLHIGDSICTNGVCLTVTTFDDSSYTADVMPETMSRTNFKDLRVNDLVNLERAMPADGRFGGHIVSGHVDGRSRVKNIKKEGEFYTFELEYPSELAKYTVKKMLKKRFYIVPGITIKTVSFFAKIIPDSIMAKMCYNNQTKKI